MLIWSNLLTRPGSRDSFSQRSGSLRLTASSVSFSLHSAANEQLVCNSRQRGEERRGEAKRSRISHERHGHPSKSGTQPLYYEASPPLAKRPAPVIVYLNEAFAHEGALATRICLAVEEAGTPSVAVYCRINRALTQCAHIVPKQQLRRAVAPCDEASS